jgi:hypothetical protein
MNGSAARGIVLAIPMSIAGWMVIFAVGEAALRLAARTL